MKAPFFAVSLLMATASLAMAQSNMAGNRNGGLDSPGASSPKTEETLKENTRDATPTQAGCADPSAARSDAMGLYRNAPSDLPSSGAPTTPPTRTAVNLCK